jgi:hypothetical protein
MLFPFTAGSTILGRASAVGFPPAAVGYPPEFLDIDVYQLTGPGFLVACRRGLAYRQAGGLIDTVQCGHVVAVQHPADRGAGDTEMVTDAVGSPAVSEP